MIEVKLSQLVQSSNALQTLGNKSLQGKLAYKVGRIIKQIANELILYDKIRRQLLQKYCIKDNNNQVIINENGNAQVSKENIPIYNSEIDKLNNTQIELNISLLDLDDFENIQMTPKDMMDIDWLIKKEEA